MDKEKLKQLALKRANVILESWWFEDELEWKDEEDLTDEELEYALSVDVKISLKDENEMD